MPQPFIKKLKIAVDGIKESYENKLDEMSKNIIFEYREKRFEVYEKDTMQFFEDKRSLSDSKNSCAPNYANEKVLDGGKHSGKCRCEIKRYHCNHIFTVGEGI